MGVGVDSVLVSADQKGGIDALGVTGAIIT